MGGRTAPSLRRNRSGAPQRTAFPWRVSHKPPARRCPPISGLFRNRASVAGRPDPDSPFEGRAGASWALLSARGPTISPRVCATRSMQSSTSASREMQQRGARFRASHLNPIGGPIRPSIRRTDSRACTPSGVSESIALHGKCAFSPNQACLWVQTPWR